MWVMASISIQWAVMSMKDSLVWLTDQRSVIIDAHPVVGSLFSSILYVLTDIYATHTNCFLQLIDKFDELILYIQCNGVGCGNISLNRVWAHGHEAISKRGFVHNGKALESQYQLSLRTMQFHSPGYCKWQTRRQLSALHPCIHQSGCRYVANTKSYCQHEMLVISLSLPQIPHCPFKMVR